MAFHPIDFRGDLNDEQYAAVTAPNGPALVLAGAGSGKTRTLTYRVAYLILERGIDPRDILLLTFTNKAAREMVERVMQLTGAQHPPSWGGTFHSVGGRILRRHGHLVGLGSNYTVLDAGDAESLFASVIKDEEPGFLKVKDNPKPRVIADAMSYARNTRQPLSRVVEGRFPWSKSLPGFVERFVFLYEKRKMEMQVTDYDDLLVFWLKLLQEHEEVRQEYQRKFRAILVDEYQDTNALQSAIVDLIAAGHRNIMAVGDDAQCIYTWRGADFENIRSYPERHGGTELYKIVMNYRSTPQILNLANAVLAAQPAGMGYGKDLVASRGEGAIPRVVPLMDTRQQADFVISRVEQLFHQGVALGDIAVLYRAHFQALDLQLEFSRRGIPFVITSGVRFFEQAHVRDFVAQLRFVSNPADVQALERVMCLLPKVGPATVKKVLQAANRHVSAALKTQKAQSETLFATDGSGDSRLVAALGHDDVAAKVPEVAREDYIALVATLREVADMMLDPGQTPPPAMIIERAVEGWYGDYLKIAYADATRRREDLDGLIGFAQRFASMAELLAQLVLMNSETTDKGVEDANDSVRMTTIHQAKGLEFPVVFVISCAEDLFPLRRAVEDGDVEEERRLFYVAVTRAMDELYLSFPLLSNFKGGTIRLQPSRFVTELPPETYERLGYRPSRY